MSADALGEAAKIVGQAGAPDRLVGALEKLAQIRGLAGDLINHCICLFLVYEEMESINIAGFDAGVTTWSGGSEASAVSTMGSGVLLGHRDPDL